ncbi:MAG TPA: radical SAM protein [Kofleriaceae bacterium]|nr:radical SAM protein [Kofleriaceae bacterium]
MKITFLSVHSKDHAPGFPVWRYNLACAYLQAYLTKSPIYGELQFTHVVDYESASASSLVERILAERPDVLAASCYCWNWKLFCEVFPQVKQALPHLVIVAGGPQFDLTTGPEELGRHPALDFIVVGEGEVTFLELVEHLHRRHTGAVAAAGRPRGLPVLGSPSSDGVGGIAGLAVRTASGATAMTSCREVLEELDDIPSPYLHGIVDLETLRNGIVAIETQRGCPYTCAYCDYPKRELGTTKVRFFSEERVLKEIDLIYASKVRQLYLMDATFNSKRARAKNILRHIVKLRTERASRMAVSTEMFPELMDEEMLLLSRDANLNYIEVGVQSLNPSALAAMQRPRKDPKLREVIDIAVRNQVRIVPQIILGLPGDSEEGFYSTFDQIYSLPTIDFQCFRLLLLPGTPYRARAAELGLVYNPQPPYQLLSSRDFTAEQLERLDRFRKFALMILELKPTLTALATACEVPHHRLIADFLEAQPSHCAWDWPVQSVPQRQEAGRLLAGFMAHLLEAHGPALDDVARQRLAEQGKRIETYLELQMYVIKKGVA